jgi:hypothetical protein
MRVANTITTVVAAALVAAGVADAGAANVAPAPRDVSQDMNTVLAHTATRHVASLRSAARLDQAVAHGCVGFDGCDQEPSSIVEVRSVPAEETASHCVCYPSANDMMARATAENSPAAPPKLTGGAIPQQMQASMAGLLGFFIMCLVML